ncbi:GAP family protein [Agromyces salentinus]|uniref:GAP family protein n=1 Tax=Agromyces salentinus TaxID=269421 RepID=A0ABN2MI38_9MICO|nr:GAP family protein [Agromyces salentinus]
MIAAIGHLLPIAIAAAVSSVPIMATIVLLLSPNRTRTALPFLIGWVTGLLLVVSICTLGAQLIPTPKLGLRPNTAIGIWESIIGVALIVLAVVSWRRSRHETRTELPKWLRSIDKIGAWSAVGLALVLNVRPKAILLAIAAGLAIRGENLDLGESAVSIGFYVVIAASTVAVPIIVTLAAPKRMEPRLVIWQDWLIRNSDVVTSLIVLMVGVVVLGSGISRF